MHLRAYTVDDRCSVGLIDVIDEVYQSRELTGTDLKVIVVDEELSLGREILTGILESPDGIILNVIAPVETVITPVEVQTVGSRLLRSLVIGSVSIVVGGTSAKGAVVNATHLVSAVSYGLVDNVVAVRHHVLLSQMVGHSFYPSFHSTEEGCTFLLR